jgi:hypothetical protein
MPDETIPDDVRQFLREYIHSYEHLEVLVRLAGAPGEPWSAERVAADVPTSVQTADEALRHLAGRGVLQVTVQAGTPRYE